VEGAIVTFVLILPHDFGASPAASFDLDQAMGWLIGVRFPAGDWNFFFAASSKPALEPTQPPIHLVPGGLVRAGVKWPGCEADHSIPSSADVKECLEIYIHSPNTSS
jgi:hypothetical protein